MKKFIASVLAFTFVFSTMATVTAFAGTIPKIYLNGNKMLVQQSPFNDNGSMMVPLRTIAVNLGAEVMWDADTQTVTITQGYNTVSCRINDTTARKNAQIITLNTPAQLKDGTTYVPLRFVSEAFGADVQYDGSTNAVNITYEAPRVEGKEYDPWGRGIRTTDLPERAGDYAYVLDGVPNEMYDLPFMDENDDWSDLTMPVNFSDTLYDGLASYGYDEWIHSDMTEFWHVLEKYFDLKLNVDYRTVDEQWATNLVNTYLFTTREYHFYAWNRQFVPEDYVKYVKDNHLVIEGDYHVEPSMTYDQNDHPFIRCWVKFRINSDVVEYAQLFDEEPLGGVKTNMWHVGYTEVPFSGYRNSDYHYDFGVVAGSGHIAGIIPYEERKY